MPSGSFKQRVAKKIKIYADAETAAEQRNSFAGFSASRDRALSAAGRSGRVVRRSGLLCSDPCYLLERVVFEALLPLLLAAVLPALLLLVPDEAPAVPSDPLFAPVDLPVEPDDFAAVFAEPEEVFPPAAEVDFFAVFDAPSALEVLPEAPFAALVLPPLFDFAAPPFEPVFAPAPSISSLTASAATFKAPTAAPAAAPTRISPTASLAVSSIPDAAFLPDFVPLDLALFDFVLDDFELGDPALADFVPADFAPDDFEPVVFAEVDFADAVF